MILRLNNINIKLEQHQIHSEQNTMEAQQQELLKVCHHALDHGIIHNCTSVYG